VKAFRRGSGEAGKVVLLLALLLGTGCSADHKTSTGRTQREADSVIGQSNIPGASGVKNAMDSQDSARARAAALDTVGTGE
jgi:hypothetical protein